MEKIKVAELFAGVGGFRIGLEKASDKFEIVWSNQWEPAKKKQIASEIYIKRFGDKNHSNKDISSVSVDEIPEHNLLVGGFPCQDYSVAKSLSQSHGITGKKGVLWWDIHRILKDSKHRPEFVFLENVDRLLKSPAKQRGRDFAIMLASLSDLGYAVEWRIINAAEYGMPQRRRRIFILGYHRNTPTYQKIKDKKSWMLKEGVLAKAFNIDESKTSFNNEFEITGELAEITSKFNLGKPFSPFENCGVIVDRKVSTAKVTPSYSGQTKTIREIMVPESEIPEQFFIDNNSLDEWKYLKGAKNEERTNGNGFTYLYTEGSMIFPESLDAPSRTIVTGEGGSSPSRFKHVIRTESGKLRRLTPLELERLNMFPDNHTKEGNDIERAFLMGNALVVGVIQKIGESLASELD
jgi:DNA (cytosine-5)-methyltransferase 1